ncbi:MAG: acetyl-CoA C-acyltransferase [Gammaproteobacteria bacterium]|nr:MAG: acetyl-CoA C-acyltransferase [Gammaproteobacteria bacterium]
MSSNDNVVIVSGVRTPMGSFQGSLSSLSAVDLGAIVIKESVARAGLQPDDIQEVFMGCVLPAGLKQGPARRAARLAGLPDSTGATTIGKRCASGMKSAMLAHDLIKAGTNDIFVAGGMESMSNAPYLLLNARKGYRMGHGDQVQDHLFLDGLEDADTGKLMGGYAQDVADKKGYTREEMDQYAIQSLTRAKQAIEQGKLEPEIIPVTVKTRKGEVVVKDDEQPFNADIEKIPHLRPAFKKDGTVTAANSSSISDGASALVIMRESEAEKRGIKPMARIIAHTTHSRQPAEFTIAPVYAVRSLLEKTGWSKDDVDIYEINEAFATVAMMPIKELGLNPERVNIYGGACAQGHPVGSTGSRIVVTLMNALKQTQGKKGIASLCVGGGEATAMAIEML